MIDDPILFKPIRMGGVDLSNRIVVAPMSQYQGFEGKPSNWHRQHLGSLALGGASLLMVEATAVTMDGRLTPGCLCLSTDEQQGALAELVAFIRSVGASCAIGLQLSHAGRKGSVWRPWEGGGPLSPGEGGWPTVAPSALPFRDGDHPPTEMSLTDIDELTQAFTSSAERAFAAGVDVVELHAVHGSLLHQFLSPLTNHRTDRYGGDGKARLIEQIVGRIVAVCPRDRAFGVRLAVSDGVPGGLSVEDATPVATRLGELGISYICISTGGNTPPSGFPTAPCYQAALAGVVKRALNIPVRVAGLIVSPFHAEVLIAGGDADLVAIGRGFLDDPRWGWHAADSLGSASARPAPYLRVSDGQWPGVRFKAGREDCFAFEAPSAG